MVDIETLGVKVTAPILSIGAVYFDPQTGELGETFEADVRLESSISWGAKPEAGTIRWWAQQGINAQKALEGTTVLSSALDSFARYIVYDDAQIWGNGASFDLGILSYNYNIVNISRPWRFYNERDVRTIVELGQTIGIDPKNDQIFEGVPHNALDDAIHQAKYVSTIWQALTKK